LREELALEPSESKTLITHAVSPAARFLGYEIRTSSRCFTSVVRIVVLI